MRPILRATSVLFLSTLLAGPAGTLVPVFGDDVAHARGNGEGNGGARGGYRGGARANDRGGDRDKGGGKEMGGGKASAESRGNGAADPRGKAKDRSDGVQSASVGTGPKAGSQGALASGLKGLNAAHASPQAMANAAPNSQVGRIATYKAAVEATAAAEAAQAELDATLAEFEALQASYDATRLSLTEAQQAEIDRLAALDGRQATLDGDYAAAMTALDEAEIALLNDATDDVEQADDFAAIDTARTQTTDGYLAADQTLEAERLAAQTEQARIEADIDTLDSQYANDAAAHDAEIATLTEAATYDGPPPEEALAAAANGRTLTAEELAYLHDLLGLEPPATN